MASGMTKTQLVRHLAEKIGTNNKTVATFLEHLSDTSIKETKKNGVFIVPGLGRLVKAHRKARMGRNPQTGEPIQIKAKTVVKFRVAKATKDAISPKKEFRPLYQMSRLPSRLFFSSFPFHPEGGTLIFGSYFCYNRSDCHAAHIRRTTLRTALGRNGHTLGHQPDRGPG